MLMLMLLLAMATAAPQFRRPPPPRPPPAAQPKKNLYDVLGVAKDASDKEINRRFHKLSLEYHPDRCKGEDCEKNFMEINNAHDILGDPEKRKRYDLTGETDEPPPQQGFPGGFFPGGGGMPFTIHMEGPGGGGGFGPEAFFNLFGGGFPGGGGRPGGGERTFSFGGGGGKRGGGGFGGMPFGFGGGGGGGAKPGGGHENCRSVKECDQKGFCKHKTVCT